MRGIKFRAWNESENMYSKPFGLKATVLNYTDDDGLGVIKSLTNEIVEQYTGLTDKNKVEIYEGDILSVDGIDNKIVVFSDGWYDSNNGFHLVDDLKQTYSSCIDGVPIDFTIQYAHTYKVIGNIHQKEKHCADCAGNGFIVKDNLLVEICSNCKGVITK